MARTFLVVFCGWCLLQPPLLAQLQADSARHPVGFKPFVAPGILLVGGLVTQGAISRTVRGEVLDRFPNFHSKADDLLQFAPTVAVLGLGLVGVTGQHTLKDQFILTVLSQGLAQAVTQGLKYTVCYPRPDGNGQEAFPSGHTSQAFTGATLLANEYGGRSVWYSLGGYGVATTVGVFRILKNRHWLADVLFGAGVGIGATEGVYALYPWLQRRVFKSRRASVLLPTYNGYSAGICWVARF